MEGWDGMVAGGLYMLSQSMEKGGSGICLTKFVFRLMFHIPLKPTPSLQIGHERLISIRREKNRRGRVTPPPPEHKEISSKRNEAEG